MLYATCLELTFSFIKLLLHKEEIEKAIEVIQDFCNENPSILTGHRYIKSYYFINYLLIINIELYIF